MLRLSVATIVLASSVAVAQPADLHDALEAVRARHGAPALAGAVIRDGTLLGQGVSGVRALGADQPATLDDRWPIGSCTKPMTRLMIGRLAERGIIDPNASLGALLPKVQMRPEYRDATILHVLAHRAGIQPYTEIGPRITPALFDLKGTAVEQRATFAAHVLSEEPVAEPGTRFVYSNAGFCVASVVAETKTGTPWEALMKAEVLAPLGMASSVAGPDPDAANQPRGHLRGPKGYRVVRRDQERLAAMAPAGGVTATPADFARFAGAYADLQLGRAVGGLSAPTVALLGEAGPADQGDPKLPATFFGGDGQFTSALAVWPQARLGIVVLSNAGDADDLCADAVEALRDALAKDVPSQGGGPAGDAPRGPRWGFMLAAQDDAWTIRAVEEGSLAARAGLKAGDRVTSINGTSIKDVAPDRLTSLLREPNLVLGVDRDGSPMSITLQR